MWREMRERFQGSRNRAFTLIELLVVMALVAVAASTTMPQMRDRLVQARVGAYLVPVLEAYRMKMEELVRDPLIPKLRTQCLLDRLPTYQAPTNATLTDMFFKYDTRTGDHIMQAVAKTTTDVRTGGIGIPEITTGKPFRLQLKIRRNGLVMEVERSYLGSYGIGLVPSSYTMNSFSTIVSGQTCADFSSNFPHQVALDQLRDLSIAAMKAQNQATELDRTVANCGCDTLQRFLEIRVSSMVDWYGTGHQEGTFMVALKCNPGPSCDKQIPMWWSCRGGVSDTYGFSIGCNKAFLPDGVNPRVDGSMSALGSGHEPWN